MANKKTTNSADVGFEKQLWEAADNLRGSMDASEYKNVILGLIFLKYISDSYQDKYDALVAEGEGFENDKDEYIVENIYYVPSGARWSVIQEASTTPSIGMTIDAAMEQIENENPKLKGILPKNFARPELNQARLGEVVKLFSNIKMHDHGNEKDLLGRAYEYCLSHFAEQEGKNAGEFYTPSSVVRTIVEVLKPFNGRVYDPCCGSGGMFVQSAKFIENHGGKLKDISVYGQESNPTTWKLAQMNLAIRGIDANLGPHNADTFTNDLFPHEKMDYIMANPPFNDKKWFNESLKDDPRWSKYGLPPAGNANFAWIEHMISHLKPNGKIGLVLANGALSSQSGGEGAIRENIIKDDMVDCIIAMPEKLFYSTGIPVSLWFLNKNKKHPGKTLFLDAKDMGTMVSRKLREFTDDDIKRIGEIYDQYQKGTLEDKPGHWATVSTEDIAKQDYILTPGRYVGIEEEEDDGVPFDEKMKKLTSELSDLFKQSNKLEGEIREQLGRLGYEI
ncbi:type I restriction-modification system subunit M [Faecalibaculum rodentium]|uniref:class I SAM-dependent DNA methyltransferase n=1 Tax=Faecalibaculum rodentium TaxID=1702221 RepID=UPI0025A604AA|nr:class I SAM-dependent DNA methyltransferase [Faecalibaculum rodentium]